MRYLKSLLLAAAELLLIYSAMVDESTGARNLVYAISVLHFVEAIVISQSKEEFVKIVTAPKWLQNARTVFRACVAVNFVWYGWWICAIGYGLSFMALEVVFSEANKKPNHRYPDPGNN